MTDHGPLIELMRRVREEEGVKHVFIASGVRYDLAERSPEFIEELARHHTGGQLSVAPEHIKPARARQDEEAGHRELRALRRAVRAARARTPGKEQYLTPVLHLRATRARRSRTWSSSRCGSRRTGRRPRQVQDFIPTPMSMATCMYYTGIDPLDEQAGLHGEGPAREEAAEGAPALLEPGPVAARARGAARGRPRGPHRHRTRRARSAAEHGGPTAPDPQTRS